jgi:hypothetical protein
LRGLGELRDIGIVDARHRASGVVALYRGRLG